ncbi:amino acid permease [Candidatus Woesearchaeota archaeon]|nr:amino acid permease [Candidatus Woesearchaeota archaeon]
MKQKVKRYKLKRELNLFTTTLYGVGIILGAGIYALIGVAAGIAGNMLWLAFLLSAILAFFTGLSYAELASSYPKEAAEYNYTKKAFNNKNLSFIVGWLLIMATILASATVALGFSGYLSNLIGGNIIIIAIILIVLLSLLNYHGIKESATFNVVGSVIEAAGLVFVALIGLYLFSDFSNVNFFELPKTGFTGILSAVALIFFAYLGFEDIANVSEEVKNARKIVPKALVFALIISTILYMLVSISSIGVLGWEALSASKAPLADVVGKAIPNASILMSIIALFATSNTVLILLIVGSRILYGISSQGDLPKFCSVIGKRGTPYYSVFIIMALVSLAILIGNIGRIAMLTDLSIFMAFFFVNASLIKLRYSKGYKPKFKSPSIGNFPILAVLGALSSLYMLFHFNKEEWLMELGFVIVGLIVFYLFKKK